MMDRVSDALLDLVFAATNHGVDSVRSGGPLLPFLLCESASGERQLNSFMSPTLHLDQAVAAAREQAAALPPDVTRAALAYEGYLTLEGARSEAIYVEAAERGEPAAVFAQRFVPRRLLRPLRTHGVVECVGETDELLPAA